MTEESVEQPHAFVGPNPPCDTIEQLYTQNHLLARWLVAPARAQCYLARGTFAVPRNPSHAVGYPHRAGPTLDGLGEKVKQAFLLAQIDGLAYADIANELSVSLCTVKNYMVKALVHCSLMSLD